MPQIKNFQRSNKECKGKKNTSQEEYKTRHYDQRIVDDEINEDCKK